MLDGYYGGREKIELVLYYILLYSYRLYYDIHTNALYTQQTVDMAAAVVLTRILHTIGIRQ